jgi:hypothetical protein
MSVHDMMHSGMQQSTQYEPPTRDAMSPAAQYGQQHT